jgi:predicted dehydrogenase
VDGNSPIGVGVLGYAGVARAHLQAILRLPTVVSVPRRPIVVAVAGRSEAAATATAQMFGAQAVYTEWRRLVDDPRVEILINTAPNDLHADPCVAAAARHIHILCEKPLARSAPEAAQMLAAVAGANIVHMTGYNYRFVPAVRLARRFIDEGRLGRIYHFRARFCDESMIDAGTPYAWRHNRHRAGSGSIGDLAAHAVDMARYLVGEIDAVSAATRIFIDRRPRPDGGEGTVDVEDAVEAVVEFTNGALGTLEASTFCAGRKNLFTFEVNGAGGSLAFNLERLNELQVSLRGDGIEGFRSILVTDPQHPYGGLWWPPGHILGWEHAFVHQLHRFLTAIVEGGVVAPEGATFEDGYRCAVVCDALYQAGREGRRVKVVIE